MAHAGVGLTLVVVVGGTVVVEVGAVVVGVAHGSTGVGACCTEAESGLLDGVVVG